MITAWAKTAVSNFIARRGFGIVRLISPQGCAAGTESLESRYETLAAAYHQEKLLRQIHKHDVVELEEMYRQFVFPDLPKRDNREDILAELIGTSVGEALYIVYHLHKSLDVAGDACEFGVAQGATSRLLGFEIMPTDRHLWLFDSFEGLPAPSDRDKLINDIFKLGSMDRYQGTMKCDEHEAREKLNRINFPDSKLHVMKGWVADTFKRSDLPSQVAFAYIDCDFYEPIRETLAFLHRTLAIGGRIVIDDYGFFSEGAQSAVDEFVRGHSGYAFELPLSCAGHFAILTRIAKFADDAAS